MKRSLSKKNLWECMPSWMRSAIGWSLALVPRNYLLGTHFRRTQSFIEEAQWWSAERAREYQLEQLRRICTLAYERAPYYQSIWKGIGFDPCDLKSPEDIRGLPTIDKETVRDNLDQMMAVSADSRGIDYISTGGSSGTTLRFYIGKDRSAIEYAYLVSAWHRVGYRLGMPMAEIRGRVMKYGRRYEYDPLLRHHYYSNFDMTNENMSWYLQHISRLGPCFLHVYPSSAATLAAFCRRTGATMPQNILGILAESENVYPEQRDMLATVCKARFFSSYGHSEKLVAAAECEHSTDFHVWPTYGYFELLDEAGQPITTPGERGEIVGTGFINTVMPFIRYRTGDYATYVGDRCEACGREQTIIRDIRGHRIQEVLIAEDGSEISWTAVNMHDDTFDDVRQFQFYQDTPGQAVLRIVPAEGFKDENRSRIMTNLGKKLGDRLTFRIETCESIPLSPRGKAIYVDQRIASAKSE